MCLMSLSVQKSFIQYTNALLNCKLIQANNAFDKQNTSDTMEPRTHSTYYNLILTELDYQLGYIISICDCLTQSWCPYLLDTYTYYWILLNTWSPLLQKTNFAFIFLSSSIIYSLQSLQAKGLSSLHIH